MLHALAESVEDQSWTRLRPAVTDMMCQTGEHTLCVRSPLAHLATKRIADGEAIHQVPLQRSGMRPEKSHGSRMFRLRSRNQNAKELMFRVK